jgi:NADPH-dependent curcumin reductase CurA
LTFIDRLRLFKRPVTHLLRSFKLGESGSPVPSAEPAHCSLSERRTKCGVAGPIESCDPTQRGWIAFDTYLPAVKIGEAVRSIGAGRIVASNNPDFAVGGIVSGPTGWQDYVAINPKGQLNKLPPGASLELAISVLALTGIAAYFGLLDVGRPGAGETVVVSGDAAGATGSVVGQIAKIKGCRAVGIAGGAEK